ncbi:hypothetical protein SAMN03159496_05128 [Rhizobium sp. NFR07]|nr:hypothetical protein SAMN03159496_05128 [Rhizobium sp. NFR07]
MCDRSFHERTLCQIAERMRREKYLSALSRHMERLRQMKRDDSSILSAAGGAGDANLSDEDKLSDGGDVL